MGLRSRTIEVDAGRQGDFRVRLSYDQIPSFKTESGKTFYDGAGTDTLTVPAGWVPYATTDGMTQLIAKIKPVRRATESARIGVRRSEERRVGKACVRKCRIRWATYHTKTKS